jgi:2-polyprenyl-3-methyl-5-hydroxy-6-metoxy-1,4-benzoquinol methylase
MLCHACTSQVPAGSIRPIQRMVASDCQPVGVPLELLECPRCGHTQKATTQNWERACAAIYSNYRIYHQAAGREQKVRGIRQGSLAPRSDLLIEFLADTAGLADTGNTLDIGCGNGAFLTAFHRSLPDWRLAGTEINATFRHDILATAPGARFFDRTELEAIEERFDLVTLIHCIEHIPHPIDFLADLRRRIAPGGQLMIQVPDAELNPFDLLIADHASHFSKAMLEQIVKAAGYDVVSAGNLVLGKEITVLARPHQGAGPVVRAASLERSTLVESFLDRNLAWIEDVTRQARELARVSPIGIFGSSIAASWLAGELGPGVAFFVDEDPDRTGRTHLGRPIVDPPDVPRGSIVLLALEPALARRIHDRLASFDFHPVLPGTAD